MKLSRKQVSSLYMIIQGSCYGTDHPLGKIEIQCRAFLNSSDQVICFNRREEQYLCGYIPTWLRELAGRSGNLENQSILAFQLEEARQ